ncbi:LOW QUALITY PROTEIN: hypothetical protein HID58_025081 [Brassica napus]|uniref:cellulase n=1 Tax=Brassica napus TaxID=3708 RepID=A0ABQ8CM46_BRANA|nr:LOW QUALITY PROTEIN: hypothetical protein HID58_025081 [Brassica napus]
MAAASIVFREVDSEYPLLLLATAKSDEFMWGAAWLLKATNDLYYKNFVESLGDGDQPDIFNWDSKYAGAYVLLSHRTLLNKDINFELCKILPDAPSKFTHYYRRLDLPQSNPQYNRHNFLAHNLHQVHESHTTHIGLRKLHNHRPQRLDKRIEETSGLHTRR